MKANTILNMDCLEGMKRIPDGSVDMILCDLPYGTTQNKWDSVIDLERIWEHYKRVVKPGAAIVLTAQQPFTVMLGASNLPWLKYEWIWSKTLATGFINANRFPLKAHENVLVFCQKKHTYNPQMVQGRPYRVSPSIVVSDNYARILPRKTVGIYTGSRYPKTVLSFSHDRPRLHPTQKPVALFEYLIRTYTNPGELVLDNCMGSGTTAIAALNSGRRFIGFENETRYFEAALDRIRNHTAPAKALKAAA